MINYSILIPHKNQPLLLQKCINSVPLRDDVQIIVVDDNSDPEIVDFNNFPGKDNPMVEIHLTKEGKGAGYARNVGLPHVKGKWLTIIGADDYFNPCLSQAMDEFADTTYDVVFFKGTAIRLSDGKESTRGDELNNRIEVALNTGDFTLALLYSGDVKKFFNMNFIKTHNLTFNEVRWGNDVVFMSWVAYYAQSCCASNLPIYCITESDTSLIKSRTKESLIVRFLEEGKNVEIVSQRFPFEKSIYYWYFRAWFNLYKVSKAHALKYLPKSIKIGGVNFMKEIINAKFS
ncbi:MAG: glycosyltransferase family 2 protein [Bacteroidia bacterium]|nr:glycosyltransferase family 2 protein [Bacteroidia bacterium]